MKAQLAIRVKNLIWFESGSRINTVNRSARHRVPDHLIRECVIPPVRNDSLPQPRSITGGWRCLGRLDAHGTEFVYVNLGRFSVH